MTALVALVAGVIIGSGVWLLATALAPAPIPLNRAIAHLHRPAEPPNAAVGPIAKLGRVADRLFGGRVGSRSWEHQLRIIERPPELHSGLLTVAAIAGFLGPLLVNSLMRAVGLPALPLVIGVASSLAGAALGVAIVHIDLGTKADLAVTDLRHQLSAYLNVLTMLLAAEHANEGALKHAAEAGDGRLFVELRRRITEAATAGRSAVTALHQLGTDLGLVELQEIANSASLATSQGAPVSRSLAAKTETLRAALQADAETDARLRTSRITFPLIAMGLVFMAIGMYPALTSINQGT